MLIIFIVIVFTFSLKRNKKYNGFEAVAYQETCSILVVRVGDERFIVQMSSLTSVLVFWDELSCFIYEKNLLDHLCLAF